jgi:deoxyhypusine synthase
MAVKAVNTGMIILGGGLIKHHICNANLMVIFQVDVFAFS